MDDLIALVKKIREVKSLDELNDAQELGDSFLRKHVSRKEMLCLPY